MNTRALPGHHAQVAVDDGAAAGYSLDVYTTWEGITMMRRMFAAAIASAFLAVTIAPMAGAQEKKTTPQQQKMKDCAGKWKDEKAKTGAKGRAAYRTFMSGCLKA
jgi:hypothetical protein